MNPAAPYGAMLRNISGRLPEQGCIKCERLVDVIVLRLRELRDPRTEGISSRNDASCIRKKRRVRIVAWDDGRPLPQSPPVLSTPTGRGLQRE